MKKIIIGVSLFAVALVSSFTAGSTAHAGGPPEYAELSAGWNLVYGLTHPEHIISGIDADAIRAIYAYVPATKQYARVYPNPETSKLQQGDTGQIHNTAYWVYSEEGGSIKYKLTSYYALDARQLYKGWNFVGLTKEFANGFSLARLKGSCTIQRAYWWDHGTQSWDNVPTHQWFSESTAEEMQNSGMLVRVSNDCRFGDFKPPSLPYEIPVIPEINIDPVTSADHKRGAAKPDVTIVEYCDLEGPFCARFHNTMKSVVAKYDGEVQWVFRHFPLTSIHPNAQRLAEAAECAADQGKFWEIVDLMYEEYPANATEDGLRAMAKDAGANGDKLISCVNSGKHTAKVNRHAKGAQTSGGRGTPHSVAIGSDGSMITIAGAQPYASVVATIKELL